jgi:chemosensory pili system protein ChpA (sensor histidine kinase/response regulator)
MADNRNFAALDWLIHEIGETLKEARQALEAYVENPKDAVRIRFCLTHIHQVHGSLQMVEFFGAAMLAEEMEKLTQAMIQGSVSNAAEAQEVLMRAILQFPVYLDQVKATRKDNPLVVLPLLNDLRAVRGESLLTDTKLFVPNLAPAKKVTGARSPAAQDNVQFQAMALKLRQMYQYAAAGYIRNVNSDENLAYLQKVFNRLHKLTHGTARHALWDICLALAEALEIDAIEMSVAIKNLLRQLDKEIKILAVHGTKALNSYTNDELIKNLLYYVARAGKHTPGFTPNSHLQRIYETYHLDEALIEGKESGNDSSNMLSAPDPEAMRSVVEALKTELNIIKHALDVCLSGGDSQTALNEALPVVKRIGDTMAVLGLGDLRKQVLEQGAALEMVANSDSHLSQDQLMSIASKVIEIEDALDGLTQQQSTHVNNDAPSNEADITLTRAKESVLRESRNGLEHAKDAIVEYIASQWDRVHLQNVPDTLREIRGGLEIMPLPRAARILGACARYIEEQLLAQEITPQWSSLDTLADAITSVEYYLERLSGGSTKEENDLLLTVAEESVATLGYAVAKISRADVSSEGLNATRSSLLDAPIHTTHEAAEADEASLAAAYESALQPETPSGNDTTDNVVEAVAPQPEPPSLLHRNAPSIGNHYPSLETTISVSSALMGSIGAALNAVAKTTSGPVAPVSDASNTRTFDPVQIANEAPIESSAQIESNAHIDSETQLESSVQESVSLINVSEPAEVDEPNDAAADISAADETIVAEEGDDENYIDDEIIEIFVEEAGEVLEAIAEYFPRWAKNLEDENSLTEFRRAFHTLKGSGRMVGANDIGELSWSIESMLNRVLDKTIQPSEPHIAIIEKVRTILPAMVEAFSHKRANPHPELSEHYRSLAESLAKGVVPDELLSGATASFAVNESVGEFEEQNASDYEEILLAGVDQDEGDELEEIELETPIVVDAVTDEPESESPLAAPVETEAATTMAHEYSSHDNYLVNDPVDDPDAQLWDIFGAEALTHLQTLQDFIAHMEAEAPIYEPPSDSVQRALHTLKGSAHMAEITPIAELAAPLEKFVKELRSYHVVINEDILQLLRDAVSYTQMALAQIEHGEEVDIPRLYQFTARVAELREMHVALLVRQQELDENGKRPVDPELLSIFMAEEMDLLLDADKIIAQWQSAPAQVSVLQPVLDELRNLNRGAHHAYLPIMVNLGEKIEQVYTHIIAQRLACSDSLCRDLNSAHIALLDMVDAIAAGQNLVSPPESILQALDDLIADSHTYPSEDLEPDVNEQLASVSFESLPSLDEQVDVDSDISLPLIEEVDYQEIVDDELSETVELAEEYALTAADTLLADSPLVERIAADVTEESQGFTALELDESAESYSEEITLSAPDASDLGEELLLDELADEDIVPTLPIAEILDVDDAEEITLALPEENQVFELGEIVENDLEELALNDQALTTDTIILDGLALGDLAPEETQLDEGGASDESEPAEFVADLIVEAPNVVAQTAAPKPAVLTPVAPPRQAFNAEDDEDYDPEIVEIFVEEATELLEDMERALHDWQEDWNNTECVEELKRCLHTFKGGARLAGLVDLGDQSHDYETMLIEMDTDAELDQNFFKQLNAYQDQLHSGVGLVQARLNGEIVDAPEPNTTESEPEVEFESLNDAVMLTPQAAEDENQFEAVTEYLAEPASSFEPSSLSLVIDNDRPVGNASQKPNVLTFAPKPKPPAAPLPKIPGAEFGGSRQGSSGPVQHLAARRAGPQEVVKVSAELLEELVNLAGETSISRGRMEQQVSDLGGSIEEMDATIHRLQEQLRRLDIETEAQVLFRQEQMMQHEQFDPLEMDRYSQLQQLSRSLIESASDLMDLKYTLADKTRDTETLLLQQSRINTDLQEGLMRSRMVPFSRLVPRLRRIVRQAATELGKEVDFELDNVEGELDRTVLERMVAPLEHMLRNAVDHGIEMPDDRAAAGKPATGRIILSLSREGGDVMLRLADDGRGINLQRVREKAIERGLMAEDAPLSDQDLMQFILHAGFSTADKVTQISGRGVGMDVVHSEIKQLGGAMFIDSRWGEGTEFTIRLPFTVSVNRALMVQIGDDLYAIPLNTIEGIVRVSPFELEHYYQDPDARFDYAGDNYLVRYLGTMLDSDATPKLDGQSLPLPVILVRSTENTVALQVDRLLGSREIVVKTLGAQFSAVRGVSGATVTGDGSVVVILDLHALIREQLALGLSHAILLDSTQVGAPKEEDLVEKTVMVVDDSVTVRKVTGRFLEREGFRVITAKDGVEALQLLQDHIPDVMLLDIEMPRMDGFEVAKNIRTSSRLRDIPIIMITSRTGEKHRDHAFELGVNKYMGKPYQEDLLLSNIKELIR